MGSNFKPLTQSAVLELVAKSMEITDEQLISSIQSHEEYIRWHEGNMAYRVLDEDES